MPQPTVGPPQPGECFYVPAFPQHQDPYDRYYKQEDDFVLHVNAGDPLINKLEVTYLQALIGGKREIHPISTQHMDIAINMVMTQMNLPPIRWATALSPKLNNN